MGRKIFLSLQRLLSPCTKVTFLLQQVGLIAYPLSIEFHVSISNTPSRAFADAGAFIDRLGGNSTIDACGPS